MVQHTGESPNLGRAKREADELTAVYSSPPIPVLEIAERSGVNVIFANFGPNSARVAGFCDFRNAKLFVNVADGPRRQSFTIAHELGHWLMHRSIFVDNPALYPVLPRFSTPLNNGPLEKEANTFAAHLLVPDRLLKPVLNPGMSAVVLANIFFVSRTMMEIRMKGR
ncbi:MAG: ImmA/IrrE family metallo-endopeptidase [Rhodothermaceae bacterium]|nr:ImmA/IrrE family metallo-endopeptidase [Rhodothermaceae bacterium]MXX58983.1 ImmA/IrrE family metallo-endopeptidase [Rhodothermaceae bacterium]MYD20377.1 ImmA/IrrE family metallo-endopeptidase [Rhodothermaceae bacterium]MYD55793.1 ImmA/IrrE family metallo-endopeptidase [Rhodothermaceae bacterium]MYI43986.1 ImmA/IrrE family metallo-endopeptidase [Rhodothermaceae bacterium]